VKPLAFLYVAVQLMLAVPAVATAPTGTRHTPCAQMAGVPMHDEHCPCCPEGSASMKDCLASCTLAATMSVSTLHVPAIPERTQITSTPVSATPWISEPPLKPPPIS
jgi:hypothetical protein